MRQRRAALREPVPARDCLHCGRSFTPARRDARYCTDSCRTLDHQANRRQARLWQRSDHGWVCDDDTHKGLRKLFGNGIARTCWEKRCRRVGTWTRWGRYGYEFYCDNHRPQS